MALPCNPSICKARIGGWGSNPIEPRQKFQVTLTSVYNVHDVERVSMAYRACDHYLWISLNLLKRVLLANGKNLKGGAFDSPWS